MSDIAERVRALCPHDVSGYCECTAQEAADKITRLEHELSAAQAREKVLLEALNYCADNVPEFWTVPGVKAALNQPTDDTALRAALKAERERCRLHDAADIATKAMRKAWQLGQTYWQQADSDSYKQNAKSAITQDSFNDLLDSTAEAIRSLEDE